MDSLKTALANALTALESSTTTASTTPLEQKPSTETSHAIPPSLEENPHLSASQARFATEHGTCAMCDSSLEVRHDVNRKELRVKEEAHCPSCGIRVRSNRHLMH